MTLMMNDCKSRGEHGEASAAAAAAVRGNRVGDGSGRKSASDEGESSQVKEYLNYCLFKSTGQMCNILRGRSHCLLSPFFPGKVVEKVSNTALSSRIDNEKE